MKTRIFFFSLLFTISSCTNYYYRRAIKDAYVPLNKEVISTLTAVEKSNAHLKWKNINGEDYVLVVSWKPANAPELYFNNKETGFYNTGQFPIFATVVPDLKNWYSKQKRLKSSDLSFRIKQLLGISPDTTFKYEYFVEFWVHPRDLIRPCFDAEISDNTCNLNLTDSKIDCERLRWLTRYISDSYSNTNYLKNFPFTRLGYTYDWNKKNKKHNGLSEFVITENKNIVVERIVRTNDYFGL